MQQKGTPMDTIGFGLIGTGFWGALHSRVYRETAGVKLLGVTDLVGTRAQVIAKEHGATPYADYHDLLNDDRIKAVSIVTPDFAHTEIALAAAQAGKHILCEKPLAMAVGEAQQIVAAAERAGVKLMVDFHARWSTPFYKAWEAIRQGKIGEPQHVFFRLSDRIAVPTEILPWPDKTTVMWYNGSHSIDTLRWLLDDEVKRVYAVATSNVLLDMGIDTPDFYLTTLQFRKGATAVMENSWIMPNSMPIIIDLKLELVGTRGAIYSDASHNRTLETYTDDAVSYPDIFVMPTVYDRQQGFAADSIRHFIDCVVDDKQPAVTGQDGLEVTKVICAIEESVRTGLPVDVA